MTGVTATSVSDADAQTFLTAGDAKIDRLIGQFTPPYPMRIVRLSTLLAAKDAIHRIPDWKNRDELIAMWEKEAEEILDDYRSTRQFKVKATSYKTDYLKREEEGGTSLVEKP